MLDVWINPEKAIEPKQKKSAPKEFSATEKKEVDDVTTDT